MAAPRGKTALKKGQSGRAHKIVDGIKYYPALYAGRIIGHGNYIAAIDESGELLIDTRDGRPIPYRFLHAR